MFVFLQKNIYSAFKIYTRLKNKIKIKKHTHNFVIQPNSEGKE